PQRKPKALGVTMPTKDHPGGPVMLPQQPLFLPFVQHIGVNGYRLILPGAVSGEATMPAVHARRQHPRPPNCDRSAQDSLSIKSPRRTDYMVGAAHSCDKKTRGENPKGSGRIERCAFVDGTKALRSSKPSAESRRPPLLKPGSANCQIAKSPITPKGNNPPHPARIKPGDNGLPLPLRFAFDGGPGFFHGGRLVGQRELRPGCEVLHVVAAVVGARERLPVVMP